MIKKLGLFLLLLLPFIVKAQYPNSREMLDSRTRGHFNGMVDITNGHIKAPLRDTTFTGELGEFTTRPQDSIIYAATGRTTGKKWVPWLRANSGAIVNWGDIQGSITNQVDLINLFATKQDVLPPGTNLQYFRGDKTLATFPSIPLQLVLSDGTFTHPTGTYPNLQVNVTLTALSQLTQDMGYITGNQAITISGDISAGPHATTLNAVLASIVSAGSCVNCSVTVDAKGRVTAYSTGSVSTPVSSVFGRTGAITAQTGDYTAAQVTNAADVTGSYSNPSWITSLAYSKITGDPGPFGNGLAGYLTKWGTGNNLTKTGIFDDSAGIRYIFDMGKTILLQNSNPATASIGPSSVFMQDGGIHHRVTYTPQVIIYNDSVNFKSYALGHQSASSPGFRIASVNTNDLTAWNTASNWNHGFRVLTDSIGFWTDVGNNAMYFKSTGFVTLAHYGVVGDGLTSDSSSVKPLVVDANGNVLRAYWKNLGGGTGGAVGALLIANNLSDLGSASLARANLGLGNLSILNSPLPIANGGFNRTTLINGIVAGSTSDNAYAAVTVGAGLNYNAATRALSASATAGVPLVNHYGAAGSKWLAWINGTNDSLNFKNVANTYALNWTTLIDSTLIATIDTLLMHSSLYNDGRYAQISGSLAQYATTRTNVNGVLTSFDLLDQTPAEVATITTLPTNSYSNGTSGLGRTLTASANGALPSIDGYSLSANERVLVKDEASAFKNGLYVVTTLGSAGTPWVLTGDNYGSKTNNTASGQNIYIRNGTINGTALFYQATNGPITLGTTNLVYNSIFKPLLTKTNTWTAQQTHTDQINFSGTRVNDLSSTVGTSQVFGYNVSGTNTSGLYFYNIWSQVSTPASNSIVLRNTNPTMGTTNSAAGSLLSLQSTAFAAESGVGISMTGNNGFFLGARRRGITGNQARYTLAYGSASDFFGTTPLMDWDSLGNVYVPSGAYSTVSTQNLGVDPNGKIVLNGVGGGSGFPDPLTNNGDLIQRIAGITTRTAIGSTGQIPHVAGGLFSWFSPAAADVNGWLGYTAESTSNKSTTTTLGASNTLYPSQNAVKVYVDNAVVAGQALTLTNGLHARDNLTAALGGLMDSVTKIDNVNGFSLTFDNFAAATNQGFRVNFGSDAGWDMIVRDSATNYWTRKVKGTPGQVWQMLSAGGLGWGLLSTNQITSGTLADARLSANVFLKTQDNDLGGFAIFGGSAKYNNQTGTTYTLLSSDNGKVVTISNASAITLTVPAGLPIGFNCLVVQLGAGQITITASSTTINNRQGFNKTAGQYSTASILSYATNTYTTGGDMQ